MKYTFRGVDNMVMKNGEHVFDGSKILKDNAMLKHRPELFLEWDFEKNDELGLDVYDVTYGSGKKTWWNCPDCKSGYPSTPGKRVSRGCACSYCSGQSVNHTNSLAALRPDIASEWHPTLNGNLTPHDFTSKSNKVFWWLADCGHYWLTTINKRTIDGNACPYCFGNKTLKGFNDMWTTNPKLASTLRNPEEGYKYKQNSNSKVDWICPECKTIIKNRQIGSVNQRGLVCSSCSDGRSFGEKLMFNLLKSIDVEFEFDEAKNGQEV